MAKVKNCPCDQKWPQWISISKSKLLKKGHRLDSIRPDYKVTWKGIQFLSVFSAFTFYFHLCNGLWQAVGAASGRRCFGKLDFLLFLLLPQFGCCCYRLDGNKKHSWASCPREAAQTFVNKWISEWVDRVLKAVRPDVGIKSSPIVSKVGSKVATDVHN